MLLGELARILGGELRGDAALDIAGVAGLEDAGEGDLSFVASAAHMKAAVLSRASCLLVAEFDDNLLQAQLKVPDPHRAFAQAIEELASRRRPAPGIHPLAHIDASAVIGKDVSIGAGAVVEAGASIGEGTIVYAGAYLGYDVKVGCDSMICPNVTVMDNISIGSRVIIHAGAVIGSDGFGYIQRDGRHVKVPQAGTVIIEDDVEIGACACIDRATTGATIIGAGAKLDNLVHIAHNVRVGSHAALAAQFGTAGSATIGKWVMTGGQVGVADHVTIADGSVFGGQSGVLGDIKEKGIYAGAPAMPVSQWLKVSAIMRKLPELFSRVRALEKKASLKKASLKKADLKDDQDKSSGNSPD